MIDLSDPILDEIIAKISEISALVHSYGWAEANAGNLSVDVTDIVKERCPDDARTFLVSRTGSRYRQTAKDPRENLLLIISKNDEDSFSPPYAKPTSEWISHRSLQFALPEINVILHTHPAEIVALNDDRIALDEALLNSHFQEILPEMSVYLPHGIALCPLLPPGSEALCLASAKALKNKDALIWNGHGLLTLGKTLDQALDYQEIIVKAARIHFLKIR